MIIRYVNLLVLEKKIIFIKKIDIYINFYIKFSFIFFVVFCWLWKRCDIVSYKCFLNECIIKKSILLFLFIFIKFNKLKIGIK